MKTKKRERDLVPGEVFQSPNGNLYVVLPDLRQAYIGNADFSRSDMDDFLTPRMTSDQTHEVVASIPSNLWA